MLEFELRKKDDEIKGLRDQLTKATVGCMFSFFCYFFLICLASDVAEEPSLLQPVPTPVLMAPDANGPELRALRFLIHEQLVNSGCKMTAIQFAEECESGDQQDLEDWEDVCFYFFFLIYFENTNLFFN